MSAQAPAQAMHEPRTTSQPWQERRDLTRRSSGGGLSLLGLAGLAAVGLVVVAGTYFAPDLERYLKMRRM